MNEKEIKTSFEALIGKDMNIPPGFEVSYESEYVATAFKFYKAAFESDAIERLRDQIDELERLCEDTYVQRGADAYNQACELMRQWQKQRIEHEKNPGCTGSLCDGIEWLYGHIETLEQENRILRGDTEPASRGSRITKVKRIPNKI